MLYQWIQHSYDCLSSQETVILEEGIQSELEVSGGFELSLPRSIDSLSNKTARSCTPTKRPVSMSASVGWVSSPKAMSEVKFSLLLLCNYHKYVLVCQHLYYSFLIFIPLTKGI